ncbi:hypothetical protein BJ546DRAFT_1054992 [Cryomyces antarcticus]
MAPPITESTLATTSDDLTAIFDASDLPTDLHIAITTPSGFVFRPQQLKGYKPTPPGRVGLQSWIWQYGEPVTKIRDGKKYWLCNRCYSAKKSRIKTLEASATSSSIQHLLQDYSINQSGSIDHKATVAQQPT